jgi:hypothetical protein
MSDIMNAATEVIDLTKYEKGRINSKGSPDSSTEDITTAPAPADGGPASKHEDDFYMPPMDYGGGHLNDADDIDDMEESENPVGIETEEARTGGGWRRDDDCYRGA